MMITMVRDPGAGRAGAVETREKNEDLFNYGIELNSAMSQCAVIPDSCPESAKAGHRERDPNYPPARKWIQDQSRNSQNVKGDDINKYPDILAFSFPPRQSPRMFFGKCRSAHLSKILLKTVFSRLLEYRVLFVSVIDLKSRSESREMRLRRIYSELSSTHYKEVDTSMEPACVAEKTLSQGRHFCGFIALCKSTRESA